MAPKRSAPPPPPSPPVASSDETASGSGSEEEDEEEIAHSPPPPAPRGVAPPPQEDQESEESAEDEDGEEEDDEEEDEKANHVIPSSATKNPPPPPPTREESETSDEEEEGEAEADDEMPQKKPAPNQEVEAKGAKRPRAPFQRTWSTDDEVRILEALAAHRLEHGTLPQTEVLADALAGKLDNSSCGLSELNRKVKSLQSRISKGVKKGALPSNDDDRRLFDLFKNVWPSSSVSKKKAATKAAVSSGAGREPDEMCQLYPYLAEVVKALQKAHPGLLKREFTMIDDSKARVLDEKIKKQRHAQMNLYLRRLDLTKEVTKTLMDLTE